MTSTVNRAPPAYAGTAVGGIGRALSMPGSLSARRPCRLLADAMEERVERLRDRRATGGNRNALALAKARRVANQDPRQQL